MTVADLHSNAAFPENWEAPLQSAGQSVETLELRSGATLILSRFDPGAPRSFSYTEPEDTFGFGFNLRGGARFEMDNCRFVTRASEVWTSAAPRGSTSQFVLPSGRISNGIHSIRTANRGRIFSLTAWHCQRGLATSSSGCRKLSGSRGSRRLPRPR